jgi:uncharacterized OB-fold protein
MTSEQILQPQSGRVPHAESPISAPFWEGCANHELRYQRCADCGLACFPPSEHCRFCLSFRLDWMASAGLGEIYSWTVVHRPVSAGFAAPYAPAIVELREGYQLLTNIIGMAADELQVRLGVRVEFRSVNADLTLPYFTKVDVAGAAAPAFDVAGAAAPAFEVAGPAAPAD